MTFLNRGSSSTAKHFVVSHFEQFQDGGLTEAKTEFYNEHLANCLECREWVERQMDLIDQLRMERPPPLLLSAAAADRIYRNLYSEMRRALFMNTVKGSLGAITAFAVLAIVVGVFIWWQSGSADTVMRLPAPQIEITSPIVEDQEVVEPAAVEQVAGSQEQELANQPSEAAASVEQEAPDLEGLSQGTLDALLLEAIRADDLAEIARLLESGADANIESSGGYSMLALAASKGSVELVDLLISHGASVDGNEGSAPIVFATQFGHLPVVEHLLDAGADVNGTITAEGSYADSAAMQWAAIGNYPEIAQVLVNHGADVNTVETLYNRTPLHGAAYYDSPEMVEFLLANGADPEMRDTFGDTALHYAVSDGVVETARILIEHGVALDTKDNLGRTLLDEAGTNSEMVQLLRDAGVEE